MQLIRSVKKTLRPFIYPALRLCYYKRMPDVRTVDETLDLLISSECSMSRFGDGELESIYMVTNNFSNADSGLSRRLAEVLSSDLPGHIIGLPQVFVSLKQHSDTSREFWLYHIRRNIDKWLEHLRPGKTYYCSHISRFYIAFRDKSDAPRIAAKLKKVWEGRHVLIVEGQATRMGIGNDLFDRTASVSRILCPATNAYSRYDEILAQARAHGRDKLILIALGQTATVLAYDLATAGYRAIDIGHIDIEYEWMLMGVSERVALENKYVNEIEGGGNVTHLSDETYRSQVVAHIE